MSTLAIPKPRPWRLVKQQRARERQAQQRAMRQAVQARDGGRCRACGRPGFEVHHVVYRSHGGKDIEANGILLCKGCHGDVHGHVLKVYGEDARTVRFERVDA